MKNLNLLWKIMLPFLAGVGMFAVVGGWLALDLRQKMAEAAGLTAARSFATSVVHVRGFYTQYIVSRAKAAGMNVTHEWEGRENAIPIPATLTRELAKLDGAGKGAGALRLYSDLPFRFRSGKDVELDAFEKDALGYLKSNARGEFTRIERMNGKSFYRYAIADTMQAESCVNCHNSHPDSPRHDWKVGDVRGALAVAVPLEDMETGIDAFVLRSAVVFGISILTLVAVLWAVLRRTSAQIDAAAGAAMRIAGLNLVEDVPRADANDEAGRLLRSLAEMQDKLRGMVRNISGHANELAGAVKRLAEESARLANTSDTQTEAASGVARAVDQVSASIDEINSHADSALEISRRSGGAAEAGSEVVRQAAAGIHRISDSTRQLADEMGMQEKLSNEITSIVGVIREVADQTNLLALNAAIEAARAGEQGRGFAVVADEVRKLAERTAQSTQMIAETVGRIQEGTRNSVRATEESVRNAEDCEQLARSAGDSVVSIQESANRTVAALDGILSALHGQAGSIRTVAEQAEAIARVTEETSAVSHRMAESSRDLSQLAGELNALAARFRI